MKNLRWVGVALSVGLLTGCPGANLDTNTLQTINALLGEYGFSLKTVDPTTGAAKTFAEADISSVVGEDGKAIAYKFESGKMVFRPTKEGAQKITVKFKDGTTQQFTVEGKQGDTRVNGDVAFIPDGSGQGFTTEVGLGTTIDVKARHDAFIDQMAAKRVKLTFDDAGIEGLTAQTIKGVYLDRMKIPPFNYVVESGALKLDPNVFYMAREYHRQNGSYPLLRVVYTKNTSLEVVLAAMSVLPQLPEFTPAKPGEVPPPPPSPDKFASDQSLDLDIKLAETLGPITLEQYEATTQLQTTVPKPGEAPPPPNATEMAAIQEKLNETAVTFEVSSLSGVSTSSVKAMWVGKQDRPLFDLLGINSTGNIKLDPHMIQNAFLLWNGPLARSTSNFPWVRVYVQDSGGAHVYKFRLKAASTPTWFMNPTGWTQPQPGQPAPPFPLDAFGVGRLVGNTDLEFDTIPSAPALETYRNTLRNASGENPGSTGTL